MWPSNDQRKFGPASVRRTPKKHKKRLDQDGLMCNAELSPY